MRKASDKVKRTLAFTFVLIFCVCPFTAASLDRASGRQLSKGKPAAEPLAYNSKLDVVRAKIERRGPPEMSKTPYAYFTDLYGVQRLNDQLRAKDVIHGLVPKYARVVSAKNDPVLRLQFQEGWKADFYFDAKFTLDEIAAVPHISFAVLQNSESVENEREFVTKFWSVIKEENLLEKFLKKNPFFKEEQIAFATIQSRHATLNVQELGGFTAFLKENNAIYLIPDAVHGNTASYSVVVDSLKSPEVDWIAIEMLDVKHQRALQVFLTAKANTKAFSAAKGELLDYYRVSWKNRFGYEERPEENHYFQLLKVAREMGKKAYAMDAGDEYILFRYGEFPLGLMSRNVVWAEQIPKEGRGLAFGGSAHMNRGQKGTVQYFIHELNPNMVIYHYFVDHGPNKKQ